MISPVLLSHFVNFRGKKKIEYVPLSYFLDLLLTCLAVGLGSAHI